MNKKKKNSRPLLSKEQEERLDKIVEKSFAKEGCIRQSIIAANEADSKRLPADEGCYWG